jgi:hypothetical protein
MRPLIAFVVPVDRMLVAPDWCGIGLCAPGSITPCACALCFGARSHGGDVGLNPSIVAMVL